ncbi:MAG: hypothetical protein ABI298_09030, partial [Acidimicrobiales bacterium]
MSPTMKAKPVPVDTVPLELDPEASDAVLLNAVVRHWHERLMASDQRDLLLSSFGVTTEDAVRHRLGLSDRTLGLRLPDRRWKNGLVLRNRLAALGVLRDSGHESFRGCVVVPISDDAGVVVGLFGRRSDRRAVAMWDDALPGDVFGEYAHGGVLLIVASIPDALAVIGAGHRSVVAPGRRKGFSAAELRHVVRGRDDVVILGRGSAPLVEPMESMGVEISSCIGTGLDVDLVKSLASSPEPSKALAALLLKGRAEAPSRTANGETPENVAPNGPTLAMEVVHDEGRGEVFLRSRQRSWRLRGAAARANTEGDLLRVALLVTAVESGRFHLDTLDLYAARQRSAFVGVAASELRAERDVLIAELAEVIAVAERCRDDVV